MPDLAFRFRSINQLMVETGYSNSPEGQCYGVMCCARQAVLLGEIFPFGYLLLLALNDWTLAAKSIKQVREDPNLPDSAKWQQLDGLLAKISRYQTPRGEFKNIRQEIVLQDYARTEQESPLMLDDRLRQQGGIVKNSFTGFYLHHELDNYLVLLERLVIKTPFPVAIVLSSLRHTITLSYDRERREWICINEGMPGMTSPETPIGELVRVAFGILGEQNGLILDTTIFVTAINQPSFATKLEQWQSEQAWQDMHRPDERKAQGVDSLQYTWLQMAVSQNNTELMGQLLSLGADMMHSLPQNVPVIFYAIVYGHKDGVETLASRMTPEQKQTLYFGWSFVHMAIVYNPYQLIDVLASCGFHMNQRTDKGISPLDIAVTAERQEAVDRLLTYVDPNDTPESLVSSLEYALVNQNTAALASLVRHNATFRIDPVVFCIRQGLNISLTWILTHMKSRLALVYKNTAGVIDKMITPKHLSGLGVVERRDLFLEQESQTISLYQLACILGNGAVISSFIAAKLEPDVTQNPLYQRLNAFIQTSEGSPEVMQGAKKARFLWLCFGSVAPELIPDEVMASSPLTGSDPVPRVQLDAPAEGIEDEKAPLLSAPIQNSYQYGKEGHTRFFQLFRVQAPEQALQVSWSLPKEDDAFTLFRPETAIPASGDALKRHILDLVVEQLNNLLSREYDDRALVLATFENAFKGSGACRLLDTSQGLFSHIRNRYGFYQTDSRRALDQMFDEARTRCNIR